MNDRLLRAAIAALAVGGAAVCGYLIWARYRGAGLVCSTGGCEAVQSSSYADVLGVSVPVLGLAAYLLIGATALARGPLALGIGAAAAVAAVAFSSYLLVIQLAVIGAVCDWCLASDAITSVLAAGTLLRLTENPQPSSAWTLMCRGREAARLSVKGNP